MKLCDLLEVIREDAQVIVVGENFEKVTASVGDLSAIVVPDVLHAKVVEVSPIDKNTVQVWVNDNECEE